MSTALIENNKRIACRFLQLVSENDAEAMCNMITDNWKMYGGPPNLPAGRTGIGELFKHLATVQQVWTINDVIAENDKVLVRATNTCSQDNFFGIPGRGKRQLFTAMFLHKIIDGKIAETYRNADDLGRVLQLGGQVVEGALN